MSTGAELGKAERQRIDGLPLGDFRCDLLDRLANFWSAVMTGSFANGCSGTDGMDDGMMTSDGMPTDPSMMSTGDPMMPMN